MQPKCELKNCRKFSQLLTFESETGLMLDLTQLSAEGRCFGEGQASRDYQGMKFQWNGINRGPITSAFETDPKRAGFPPRGLSQALMCLMLV